MEQQVKSKQRVADHGEVFTSAREVNAMLDLVKSETERVESRFLEPACGDGNFLAEILRRKLAVCAREHADDYPKYALLALSSLYGVELLADNVAECRARLSALWLEAYRAFFNDQKPPEDPAPLQAMRFILERNILCGNALSLHCVDADGRDLPEPIIFSEWSLSPEGLFLRRDFRLDEMLSGHAEQISLFMSDWEYDEETQAFIPRPIRQFRPQNYRELGSGEVADEL